MQIILKGKKAEKPPNMPAYESKGSNAEQAKAMLDYLGGLANRKCESCHQANKPFHQPLDLGDISMFQCAECHPRN